MVVCDFTQSCKSLYLSFVLICLSCCLFFFLFFSCLWHITANFMLYLFCFLIRQIMAWKRVNHYKVAKFWNVINEQVPSSLNHLLLIFERYTSICYNSRIIPDGSSVVFPLKITELNQSNPIPIGPEPVIPRQSKAC